MKKKKGDEKGRVCSFSDFKKKKKKKKAGEFTVQTSRQNKVTNKASPNTGEQSQRQDLNIFPAFFPHPF